MFKKLLKGLDSTPSTPKIGRIELPEVGEGDVYYFSKAEGSAIVDWSSDSEGSSSPHSPLIAWRRPSTPQVEAPFKQRRKPSTPVPESPLNPRRGSSSSYTDVWKAPSRSSTPQMSQKAACSRPSSPQPGSSKAVAGLASPAPVKAPRKGILKPSPPPKPVTLHWQLLPYDPARSKKLLYFNAAYPAELIRDHTHVPPVSWPHRDLEKSAAEIPLSEMHIRCSQLPHWDIIIKPAGPGGVRCLDIFREIYETFQKELSETEKDHYMPSGHLPRCEEARRRRCKNAPGLQAYNLKKGLCRVDLLEGRTIFMGLRRPVPTDDKPDRYWVLELGFPKEERTGR